MDHLIKIKLTIILLGNPGRLKNRPMLNTYISLVIQPESTKAEN